MALTIRLTKEDEKNIEKLKKQLNEPRASQALLKAAHIVLNKYNTMEFELDQMKGSLNEVENKYNKLVSMLVERHEMERDIYKAINHHFLGPTDNKKK
jgi:hypothetical protein